MKKINLHQNAGNSEFINTDLTGIGKANKGTLFI
jgi:hypothetical protein